MKESGVDNAARHRRSLPSPGASPLNALRAAAAPLFLAAPVLYFGVLRAVETGRALRQADWHFGSSLPPTVAFSDMGSFAASGLSSAAHSEVPVGEALLMVLFCLGMGCFLLSAALRALTSRQNG